MRRLDRDLELAVVELLEQLDLLDRGRNERLRLVLRASSCRCSGSEPELAPIRIGIPAFFAAATTSSTLSGPPMLPGLMRTAATPASIARSASEALKWMSAITGMGESRTIFLQRLGVLDLRHRAADDLATGRRERGDLRRRRLDVVRLRQGHRLDDDGCAAADRDSADANLRETAHRVQCSDMPPEPPATGWALSRPPEDHPSDAWAVGADLEAGTLLVAYRAGIFPMRAEGELVWWSPQRRAVIP